MGSAGAWHHPFTLLLLLLITGCRYPQGTGLGLGMAFARELDAIGALPGPIGLVPCAFGGSPLLRWERREDDDPLHDKWEGRAPDIAGNGHEPEEVQRGGLYARLVRRARAALAAKPGAVLAGALW